MGVSATSRDRTCCAQRSHRIRRKDHRGYDRGAPGARNVSSAGLLLPPNAFTGCTLKRASGAASVCEWKGAAAYWDIRAGARVARRAAWSYPEPTPAYAVLRDHVAVYAGAMEQCFVGDEVVTPQPGGFYGGWITSDIKGPFKGEPGTVGW